MAQEGNVGVATLGLLESRLQRVNFALTGDSSTSQDALLSTTGSTTTAARLRTLERHLQTLSARCEIASEILSLHSKHPVAFHPDSTSTSSESSLQPAALAAVVLSHAQLYQQLSTQLDACKSRTIPSPAILVPLVNLQTRIDQVARRQADQVRQLADLRTRSAQVLETWLTKGILDMSECWADWEERLRDVEILVRRMESAKKREEGFA